MQKGQLLEHGGFESHFCSSIWFLIRIQRLKGPPTLRLGGTWDTGRNQVCQESICKSPPLLLAQPPPWTVWVLAMWVLETSKGPTYCFAPPEYCTKNTPLGKFMNHFPNFFQPLVCRVSNPFRHHHAGGLKAHASHNRKAQCCEHAFCWRRQLETQPGIQPRHAKHEEHKVIAEFWRIQVPSLK